MSSSFYLRPDRILAAFLLDASKPPEGFFHAKAALQEELEQDTVTKDSLILVQRCMDQNEQNINEVVAQRNRREQEEDESDGVSSQKNTSKPDTNALVDAINPMLQANAVRFQRRDSNMTYFVSSIDEHDDQGTIGEEDIGSDKPDEAAKWRGSLIERQRKSRARTMELMDGAAVSQLTDRNDDDDTAKSTSQATRSLSQPPFPTVFAALLPVSVNSPPTSESANQSHHITS